jgi:hypothetical protein
VFLVHSRTDFSSTGADVITVPEDRERSKERDENGKGEAEDGEGDLSD